MKPRAMHIGTGELLPPALVGVMVLLDRSGSMQDIKAPMEAAFAAFVEEQRALSPDGMWLSLHQFDSGGPSSLGMLRYVKTYDRKPLTEVGGLDLHPAGGTPLRDALWRYGCEARAILDDPTDETERLLLVVITDGQENSSQEHAWPEVRTLLEGLETADCEIIWLGTDEALLEAQHAMPAMATPGTATPMAATAQGVNYGYGGLRAASLGIRSGESAKAASYAFTSTTAADATYAATDDYMAKALDAAKQKLADATQRKPTPPTSTSG